MHGFVFKTMFWNINTVIAGSIILASSRVRLPQEAEENYV